MENILTLLRLMHRSASVECRRKALEVLNTVFANIVNYPSEEKYKRINMTSVSWTRYIAPAFQLFCFVNWMVSIGFKQDAEHSLLCFKGGGGAELNKARQGIRDLLRAYTASVPEKPSASRGAMGKLLPLLRCVAGLTVGVGLENKEGSKNAVAAGILIPDDTWEGVKDNLRLTVLERVCARQSQSRQRVSTVSHSSLSPNAVEAWGSVLSMIRELTLSQIEEDFAVVDAERFALHETSANCSLGENGSSDGTARRRVAARHKTSLFRQDGNRASVHTEVQLVATRLIADIASCMEQIAMLDGAQGMVRKDRLEARRLMAKFNEDGDIEYLHVLKEEWSERLEATKEKHGRPFVYL